MRTVSGLFDTRDQAEAAVDALGEAGIGSENISLVRPGHDDADDGLEGAAVGATVGGVLGALAAFAIPGIGPVVGAGWLATALTGAAAGGLIGALADEGIDEEDAHVYAEGIRRGNTLVIARVEDAQVDAATAILGQSGSVNVSSRREEFVRSGWDRFDENGDPWLDERMHASSLQVPPGR
ncbi:MAG: hypothetical protein KKB66_13345 [Alphaproteobacteria bacterium]|nr:hypothetical protein [Alphaproteobacteria bacterium]MBU0805392.1 hypothetical protein [Alphaproteobacteria bacterium]MBU0873338.1 hypothetical protein [Alphaproteobacteria bacterium]MBU1401434.1 hypothetical protein [Alphaproteobacteria bacterium]MBU1592149.1 hypothetical protein [Alphaproteobacteria bacterium]